MLLRHVSSRTGRGHSLKRLAPSNTGLAYRHEGGDSGDGVAMKPFGAKGRGQKKNKGEGGRVHGRLHVGRQFIASRQSCHRPRPTPSGAVLSI